MFKPVHLKAPSYLPRWRLVVLHWVCVILGVTVNLHGWPIGSARLARREIMKKWAKPTKNNNGETRGESEPDRAGVEGRASDRD